MKPTIVPETPLPSAAREELWRAPCDLDAAELALSKLSAALEARPGGTR